MRAQKQHLATKRKSKPVVTRDKTQQKPGMQPTPKYPVGTDYRMGNEGFLAAIGGWTGDRSKKGTWLAPATGTIRNRPVQDLVDWLNANLSTNRGKRLQAFIADLKQVETLSKQIDQVVAYQISPLILQPSWDEPEPMSAIRFAHARVQAACTRYCLYPRLTWTMWEKGWGLNFYAEGEVGEVPVVYNGPNDFGRRIFEGDAAIVVTGIAQRGEIGRLRACEQCGLWFFASSHTSHNARKFCKESCRLKHFHQKKTK